MTKEQFIQFKQDLKNDIEITRLLNKYDKAWWNAGFNSEEDYNKSYEVDKIKINELRSKMTKSDNGKYTLISCSFVYTHAAYYCAKHQLQRIDRDIYCEEIFNSMKEEKRNAWPFYGELQRFINQVDKILEAYEKVVCSD